MSVFTAKEKSDVLTAAPHRQLYIAFYDPLLQLGTLALGPQMLNSERKVRLEPM